MSDVRPIDANALMEKFGDVSLMLRMDGFLDSVGEAEIVCMINNAPTVETIWIPVEEELPEIGEHHVSDVVLCYCKGGVYAFSELEENIFGQKCFNCERDDEYHCNPLEVIAWMPLPKFNEEDEPGMGQWDLLGD